MQMRTLGLLAAFAVALVLSQPSADAAGSGKLGVVFMHDISETNDVKNQVREFTKEMEKMGYLVVAPEMPWSAARSIDKTYDQTMTEIDTHVEALKKRGAARIVVAGHGLGANAAIGYGARRDGLIAVVAISPAHTPDADDFAKQIAADLKRAKDLIAAGKGDEKTAFKDPEHGKKATIAVTAKIYLDWFDLRSPSVLPFNAAKLKPDTSLMWLIGDRGSMASRGKRYAFGKAPNNPNSVYKLVNGGPDTTIKRGAAEIILWLSHL